MDQKELKIQKILFNVLFFLHLQQNSESRTQTINAQFNKVDQYRRKDGIIGTRRGKYQTIFKYSWIGLLQHLGHNDCTGSGSVKNWNLIEMLSWESIEEFRSYTFTVITLFKAQYVFTHIISSVRSSNSNPDLLLIHPPTTPLFQITPVLNTGLSLSEPLQLYKGNHWTHLLATCIT